jgi:hypothetical protein
MEDEPIPTFLSHLKSLVNSPRFKSLFIGCVYLNMIFLVLEADFVVASEANRGTPLFAFYRVMNLLFLSVYVLECSLRILTDPIGYWLNGYNIVDVCVVVIFTAEWVISMYFTNFVTPNLTFLRIISGGRDDCDMRIKCVTHKKTGLRALRAIRIVPHYRQLEVVVNALLNTMKTNVVDVLVLLFLVIFIFGVIGHYMFGEDETKLYSFYEWNTLGTAFYTLWVYVCADGWVPYQDNLTADGYEGSQLFTISFIFIGNFIISEFFCMLLNPLKLTTDLKQICLLV